ncbi:cadherin EGF LAG seven-pass G-type receptor 1-like [Babylonia areolata]|uniref:cadherin EGF LAG seven-pass G-type receptor 1-like n=1 Tax=Babylonia areolata TaxID=304850 RepID=UPI003FD488AE
MTSWRTRMYIWVTVLLFCRLANPQSTTTDTEGQLDDRIDKECHGSYYVLPECIDHPDGYGCECGPGFHWNTKMCMSSAIDSRFEFKVSEDDPLRYTLLLGRAFPSLAEFTVAFWLNVSNPQHPGTVLSYKHGDKVNLMRFMSGPKLSFEIWGERKETVGELIAHELVHVAWTWSSLDKTWQLFKNGVRVDQGSLRGRQDRIPSGGEFVLGQSSRPGVLFDVSYALEGDLSHFNIWDFILPANEVSYLASSCTFQYCGNAVQWVEFRAGTRGALRMRWPSGIFSDFTCFTEKDAGVTCDKSCSERIGAQCNEEINENIVWRRQPAAQNVSVPCPGFEQRKEPDHDNATLVQRFATRSCLLQANDNDGIWQEPYIDDCITEDLLDLKIKFQQLGVGGGLDQMEVLRMAERLLNHTEDHTYVNPIDVATVIDLLAILVETQNQKPQPVQTVLWNFRGQRYARAEEIYPTFSQTITFCEVVGKVVNNLLKVKNEVGWNATRPAGAEGDNLMRVMHRFAQVIAGALIVHVVDNRIVVRQARVRQFLDNIEFSITTQLAYVIRGVEFPSDDDVRHFGVDREAGFVQLSSNPLRITNTSDDFTLVGISTFRYKNLAKILPSHPVKSRSLEDWVNAPVMALYLHSQDSPLGGNLSSGIKLHFSLLDTFNISNPACVSLVHKRKKQQWQWSGGQCTLRDYDGRSVACSCLQPGVFTVTTDMYNDNWDKGDKRPELMNFASYFGCAASATMCLMTCFVHIYLKTSSSTAALHRNLSVSVALSQLVFMFGIDRYDHPVVCQVFAILFHYAFLTTYLWVMNEAFNMYIVITYSAISKSDLTDSGSIFRYYVIGWAFPVVLVGAFVGTVDDYYAKDMCWVSADHMWLFLGPALGIIGITILVLIFAAKEHNENSYTNSEKTNKIITIQMKGLWIQIILITVCWSFAIISITMVDRILKYLYALFNCLQGAFFIVFNLLLHEEVRAVMKGRRKKRTMQWQGYELSGDDLSLHSALSCHEGQETVGLETRPRRPGRQKAKTRIEASSDEASDHSDSEMISSV